MRLIDLQRGFKEVVLGGDAGAFSAQIEVGGRGGKTKRIEVYRNNVRQGRVRALEKIFPICRQVLGERHFLPSARGYVAVSDAGGRDLNFYGADFPEFLQRLSETYPQIGRPAFLPDLARLEWCLHWVYYAADDEEMDFAAFERCARDDPDTIVLIPSHSLSLLETKYPLAEIHARFKERPRPAPDHAMDHADVTPRSLCIYRRQWRPQMEYIDETTCRLLSAVQAGTPLPGLARQFPSLDEQLPALIGKGWISGFASAGAP